MSYSDFQAVCRWVALELESRFSGREVAVWVRSGALAGFAWKGAADFEDAGPLPGPLQDADVRREFRFFVGIEGEFECARPDVYWDILRESPFPALFFVPYFIPGSRRFSPQACVRIPQAELRVSLRETGEIAIGTWVRNRSQNEALVVERLATQARGRLERRDWPPVADATPSGRTRRAPEVARLPLPERERLLAAIADVQEHMRRGNCYLLNLTTRVPVPLNPARFSPVRFVETWFRRPTRYGAFLKLDDFSLLSFSPERFVKASEGWIVAEPIKGTQPLADPPHATPEDAKALWGQQKEICEQTMVVDLLRNDLNVICSPGSVKVHSPFFAAIAGPILQMQSFVAGRLAEGVSLCGVLPSLLPAGSVTGTPKRAVCQLAARNEGTPRGGYTGIVGIADGPREFDSAILIRSLFCEGDEVSAGVGAGITTLSNPESEVDEFELKLRSFLEPFEGEFL